MPTHTGQGTGSAGTALTGTAGDFSAALKEFYGPGLIGGLNEDIAYFDMLTEAGAEVELGGRGLIWPIHIAYSGGVASIAEDSKLVSAGTQSRTRATANARELYGRIELSRKVMAASRTNKMAFVDVLDGEMEALEGELKKQLNRQLFGNNASPGTGGTGATTGILTQIDGNQTSATLNVDTTHQMHAGMRLRIGTIADIDQETIAGAGEAVVVNSITSRTQFVASASITVLDNDVVTIGGSSAQGFFSVGHELFGLDHLLTSDDDDLFGVDTSAHPQWDCHIDANGGINRTLSPELMDAMFDGVYEKGGRRPNAVQAHNSFAREVKKMMESDVRYEPQTFKGGFERNMLVWNNGTRDVVINTDHLCLPNRAYFINLDYIKLAYLSRFSWLDEDGAVLSRVADKANFEAAFGAMLEQIVTKRNAHGVLSDVTVNESTLIIPT